MQQLTLIDAAPMARRSDPATSHAAAAAARELSVHHQALILQALARGPAGKDRIATLTSLTGVQVCRRLVELERAGQAKPSGRMVVSTAGRQEREWGLSCAS